MEREPAYWLLRRAGSTTGDRVSAASAAMIAQRDGAVGDLYGRGLTWQEPDDEAYTGLIFVTLTPVWTT